jgi:hypothetical protein
MCGDVAAVAVDNAAQGRVPAARKGNGRAATSAGGAKDV